MNRNSRLLLFMVLCGVIIVACSSEQRTVSSEVVLAPASALPPELQTAPNEVKEAYRYAIANKELLEQIPCFCGCVGVGHSSNYACYVAADGGPGNILQFDSHALG